MRWLRAGLILEGVIRPGPDGLDLADAIAVIELAVKAGRLPAADQYVAFAAEARAAEDTLGGLAAVL